MLSIEEIKLLIEKLEKVKSADFQKLIDSNLKILKDIETAVDANNKEVTDRLVKTPEWFIRDLEQKRVQPWLWQKTDEPLRRMVQTKIFQFGRINLYNSLEIGPGDGMFSMDFRGWKLNFFLDLIQTIEKPIRRKFPNQHQKYLKFYQTKECDCEQLPKNSFNFIFSWDTFVFFTQDHIRKYLKSMQNVLIQGGYCFIQYADCHYDVDLANAQRGYWNYNTKSAMEKIITDEGYEVVEMNQFRPGANYAIFRKPGKQNPFVYQVSELLLD